MTAVAIAAVVVAVVALALLGVLLGYVRQLRGAVEETRRSVQQLSERPDSVPPEPDGEVLAATAVTLEERAGSTPRATVLTHPRAGSSSHSVLTAAMGLLVVKAAALSYGLSRALSEDHRREVGNVMQAHLRARRRLRRAERRRTGRSVRR